jgi:FMN phosphatase YigB (HAD superfamily)
MLRRPQARVCARRDQITMTVSSYAPSADRIVFLLDVDNTLLDNDQFAIEFSARLEQAFGVAGRDRYWEGYAQRRTRLGFADYLGALEDFRGGQAAAAELLQMSAFLLDFPFAQLLYPRSLAAVAHLRTLGTAAVLSDGDVVFQPRKLQRSGIWDAVSGEVLICLHKEHALEFMQHRYPACHYVAVDDKPFLLAAMKTIMGERLTTVWVRQGHYALEAADTPVLPPPDLVIEDIGTLIGLDPARFHAGASKAP